MHEHVEQPIPAALAPHVRRICGYRITGCRPGTHIGLPSADITCVFDLGDGLDLGGLDLPSVTRFPASFSGLHLAPATIHHDGTQHGVMLYLTPAGLRELFGIPAAELMGTAVDPADLFGTTGRELTDRMRDASGWRCLGVLTDILLNRLPDRRRDELAMQTWRRLEDADGRVTVTQLAQESGWSERHLRSRFRAEFGVGLKDAARLMRFERSLDAVRAGSSLAAAAALTGYADQAHLTRDWHQFAGVSPSRWLGLDEFAPAGE